MEHYFYDTISHLRLTQEMILYDKILTINSEDERLVKDFLLVEYESENINYPFESPEFNPDAALWAAKIVYISCQIIFYREHSESDLSSILPAYVAEITPGAILSADLCLRFLPQILNEAKQIDPDDLLCDLLHEILKKWHYSAIGTEIDDVVFDFSPIFSNLCLEQMYLNRVIEKKDIKRAELDSINRRIKSVLGNHATFFWPELIKNTKLWNN